jgi:hypothetical protein
MSTIDSIAGLSTAMSQAKLQTEVATRVLKLAQGQNQPAADLLEAALENVQETVSELVQDAGCSLDACA